MYTLYNYILIYNIHVSILFQIFFHYKLLDIYYSSLCYTLNPCCLSILCIMVSICKFYTHDFFLPPFPLW